MSRALCASKGIPEHLLAAAEAKGLNWAGILALLKQGLPIAIDVLTALFASPEPTPTDPLGGGGSSTPGFTTGVKNAAALLLGLLGLLLLGSVAAASEPPPYREAEAPAYVPASDTAFQTLAHFQYTCHRAAPPPAPSIQVSVPVAEVSVPAAKPAPAALAVPTATVCDRFGCHSVTIAAAPSDPPPIPAVRYTASYVTSYSVSEPFTLAPTPTPSTRTGVGIGIGGQQHQLFIGIVRLR